MAMKAAAILAVLMFAQTLRADEPSLQASVDKNPVGVGDQFTFTLTLAGSGSGKNLQLPDLGKFRIMSGPNQSTSMEFVNGVTSASVSYSYILQPREQGKFTIGAASIEAGGKTFKSAPFSIEVVKGQSRPQGQGTDDVSGQIGDNLFLRASVDRTRVLQGEQINVVFKLYHHRVEVTNFVPDKTLVLQGFWGEDETVDRARSHYTEVVRGKQYEVDVMRRMALFPTQSGTLEINPMSAQAVVRVRTQSNDPFESFFSSPFGRTVTVPIKSDPIQIKVDPLPGGAPDDFKGAVGQFAMSASLDKKTTQTNEPVTLKMTVSGTGNIKLLESPAADLPTDFEQYPPKITDNINRDGEKITGSKTFELLLMPRYPGLKVIKPVTFSYFDLARKEFVRLRSPQIELNVEQGAMPSGPVVVGSGREDVQLLSRDIRFIKVDVPAFMRAGERPYAAPTFLALLALPLAGLAGAFVYSRRRQAVMLDEVGYRERRAIKVARKGLRRAEYLLKEKHGPTAAPSTKQRARFYTEVSRALWSYLGDKMGIPQAEFSVEGAMAELEKRRVSAADRQALKSLLEFCDMARFAPTSLEVSSMQKAYDEASRLIIQVEHSMRSR